MKSFYLDTHSTWCQRETQTDDLGIRAKYICVYNPIEFVLFMKNQFVIVKMNPCMKTGGMADTVLDIVEGATKGNKIYDFYDIEKGKMIKRFIEKCIETGEILSKTIYTINYVYRNNFHGIRCVATKSNIIKELLNEEDFESNYMEAKQYLIDNKKEYLLDELQDLYYANKIRIEESYAIKSVASLIKVINKQINS